MTTNPLTSIVIVGVDSTPKETTVWLNDETDTKTYNIDSDSISDTNDNNSDSDASTRVVPSLIYRINCDEDDEESDSDD